MCVLSVCDLCTRSYHLDCLKGEVSALRYNSLVKLAADAPFDCTIAGLRCSNRTKHIQMEDFDIRYVDGGAAVAGHTDVVDDLDSICSDSSLVSLCRDDPIGLSCQGPCEVDFALGDSWYRCATCDEADIAFDLCRVCVTTSRAIDGHDAKHMFRPVRSRITRRLARTDQHQWPARKPTERQSLPPMSTATPANPAVAPPLSLDPRTKSLAQPSSGGATVAAAAAPAAASTKAKAERTTTSEHTSTIAAPTYTTTCPKLSHRLPCITNALVRYRSRPDEVLLVYGVSIDGAPVVRVGDRFSVAPVESLVPVRPAPGDRCMLVTVDTTASSAMLLSKAMLVTSEEGQTDQHTDATICLESNGLLCTVPMVHLCKMATIRDAIELQQTHSIPSTTTAADRMLLRFFHLNNKPAISHTPPPPPPTPSPPPAHTQPVPASAPAPVAAAAAVSAAASSSPAPHAPAKQPTPLASPPSALLASLPSGVVHSAVVLSSTDLSFPVGSPSPTAVLLRGVHLASRGLRKFFESFRIDSTAFTDEYVDAMATLYKITAKMEQLYDNEPMTRTHMSEMLGLVNRFKKQHPKMKRFDGVGIENLSNERRAMRDRLRTSPITNLPDVIPTLTALEHACGLLDQSNEAPAGACDTVDLTDTKVREVLLSLSTHMNRLATGFIASQIAPPTTAPIESTHTDTLSLTCHTLEARLQAQERLEAKANKRITELEQQRVEIEKTVQPIKLELEAMTNKMEVNQAKLVDTESQLESTRTALAASHARVAELESLLSSSIASKSFDLDCVICLSDPRDVLFHPCGHMLTCHRCAGPESTHRAVINRCPQCQANIRKRFVLKDIPWKG